MAGFAKAAAPKKALGLAVVLLAALSVSAPAQRLAGVTIPDHYDIHLSPDFAADTFAGHVAIRVQLTQATDSITVHAAEIDFHEVTIASGGAVQTATVTLDSDSETATFRVPRIVAAGRATISIRYTGRLNDQMRGFYLSRANGRDYAITQLEATDARRAFPSFDEPAMKATFAMTATIDERDTAISNGRVVSDTPGPTAGKHTLRFATTKRMSPYLVALAVGDWECITGGADNIPIRICGTPNRKDQLGFALESAEFTLRFFNRYFAIRYPFDKLDIVAVPDFSAGAMENTGAIFFREQLLVVPRHGGTTERRKQIAQYIGHEVAHQWFGDLVTMEWWDDIWLNEGFATWMEHRPMQEWKPEWNAALDEVRDTEYATQLDSLRATRPVRTKVETPDEINEVFDAIAYQKTAAIIRMVEGYSGSASFRDGINAYLKKFAFANATGEGLWTTLAAVTKKPIDRVLSTFITHSSMPLITVAARCASGTTELTLSQRPISEAVPDSTLWDVPVCYKRESGGKMQQEACVLLSDRTHTAKLDGCSSWLFANVEGRGYYRTSYDANNLTALGQALTTGKLSAREQTTLLSDLWTLVRLDHQNIAEFLSLARQLAAGPLTPAMSTAMFRINYISEWLIDEPLRPAFEQWVRETVRPLMHRLGWTPRSRESEEVQSLRSTVLFTMGNAGRDPDVLREARRLVELHLTGSVQLHSSVVDTALQLAAISGDSSLYEQYMSRIEGNVTPSEHLQYLSALPFFTDEQLQKRTLAYATSEDIRAQDAPTLIRMLMQRPWASARTWAHVKENWDRIERSLGIFQGIPTVAGATQHLCDRDSKDDVDRFFNMRRIPGIDRTVQQSLETIQRCTATKSAQQNNLAALLSSPQPSTLSPKP